MSKIGAHSVTDQINDYKEFVRSKPSVILSVNYGGILEEAWLESEGYTYTIFRDTKIYLEAPGDINNPPGTYAQMASYWYPQLKTIWDLNPADFYTITNEQGGNDPQSYRNLVAYEREIMKLANADGLQVCVLNLASGSPGDIDMWAEICLPFILEAGEAGNIYGRHVYGGDLVNQSGDILSGAPLRPVQEMEILEGNGYASGVVLTEVGIDGGNGYDGGRFFSQQTNYEVELREQKLLIGICMWTLGDNEFNANFEKSLGAFTQYNLIFPTARWRPTELPPSETFEEHIIRVAKEQQVLSVNPDAALQKHIYADGVVPVMNEYWTTYADKQYALQSATNLGTGESVVYVAEIPFWDTVFKVNEADLEPDVIPIGVDVSRWQGGMNWHKTQENGISFAYVKSTEGSSWVDSQFSSNAGKLSGNSIIWGPYHFWSANGGVSNQLNHFWETISPSGYNLPPALDVEAPPTTISRSKFKSNIYSALTRLKTRMEANGDYRKPLLYTRLGFFNSYLIDSVLVWDDICELWLAHWGVAYPVVPSGFNTYRIHQYSSNGPGQFYGAQSDRIDMNRYNGTTEELLEWGSAQVQPQKLDMGQYFLPVAGDFGPIYILKNNWGGGDERVQLQRDGMFSFVVKNSQWEKRLIGQDYINLVMDTSPGNNEFYTVNGTWLPRKMNVGESFTRTEHVQHFSKGSCTKLRETTWASQLKFVAHFATFTNADIILNNVVQLAWIRNDVVEEEYWYAAGIGLVKWRSKHGLESGITELIPVGEQENNVREKINCI